MVHLFFCSAKLINNQLILVHMKKVCPGFFTTLSNKTRLGILYSLRKGPQSVNNIVSQTGCEQSLVSHNLKLLRDCSFVNVEIKGKQRIYSLNQQTIEPLFDLVDKHMREFCGEKSEQHRQ
jgi:DNA-binding transcriptional ArsR family regulator